MSDKCQVTCDELPLGEQATPVDLEYVCRWIPVSTPPAHEGPVCVSTPSHKDTHQIAHWSKVRNCFVFDRAQIPVTFWCELPVSPEHMAAHPDNFESCDTINDSPATVQLKLFYRHYSEWENRAKAAIARGEEFYFGTVRSEVIVDIVRYEKERIAKIIFQQGGAAAKAKSARVAHNHEVVGANPTPATNSSAPSRVVAQPARGGGSPAPAAAPADFADERS